MGSAVVKCKDNLRQEIRYDEVSMNEIADQALAEVADTHVDAQHGSGTGGEAERSTVGAPLERSGRESRHSLMCECLSYHAPSVEQRRGFKLSAYFDKGSGLPPIITFHTYHFSLPVLGKISPGL